MTKTDSEIPRFFAHLEELYQEVQRLYALVMTLENELGTYTAALEEYRQHRDWPWPEDSANAAIAATFGEGEL